MSVFVRAHVLEGREEEKFEDYGNREKSVLFKSIFLN